MYLPIWSASRFSSHFCRRSESCFSGARSTDLALSITLSSTKIGARARSARAIASLGRADVRCAHAHPKSQVLGVSKARLDPPAFAVVVHERSGVVGLRAGCKAPGLFHRGLLHADDRADGVLVGSDRCPPQRAGLPPWAHPLLGLARLPLRVGRRSWLRHDGVSAGREQHRCTRNRVVEGIAHPHGHGDGGAVHAGCPVVAGLAQKALGGGDGPVGVEEGDAGAAQLVDRYRGGDQ